MYRDQESTRLRPYVAQPTYDAEKRLWHFLRAQKLHGDKFRRQAAIGPYVVDFVCFSRKLIVELDGPQHLEPDAAGHDQRRTDWLAARGFHLIRFRNQELDENINAVVDEIGRVLVELASHTSQPPFPTLSAEGREPDRNQSERVPAERRQPEKEK